MSPASPQARPEAQVEAALICRYVREPLVDGSDVDPAEESAERSERRDRAQGLTGDVGDHVEGGVVVTLRSIWLEVGVPPGPWAAFVDPRRSQADQNRS